MDLPDRSFCPGQQRHPHERLHAAPLSRSDCLLAGTNASGKSWPSVWLGMLVLAGVLTTMLLIGAIFSALRQSIASVLPILLPVIYGLVIVLGILMLLGLNYLPGLPPRNRRSCATRAPRHSLRRLAGPDDAALHRSAHHRDLALGAAAPRRWRRVCSTFWPSDSVLAGRWSCCRFWPPRCNGASRPGCPPATL